MKIEDLTMGPFIESTRFGSEPNTASFGFTELVIIVVLILIVGAGIKLYLKYRFMKKREEEILDNTVTSRPMQDIVIISDGQNLDEGRLQEVLSQVESIDTTDKL